MNRRDLLRRIRRGAVHNVSFRDMVNLVEGFGFHLERINGSHHGFRHPYVRVKVNMQPKGREAKSYQIRQFLRIVERHDLKLEDD